MSPLSTLQEGRENDTSRESNISARSHLSQRGHLPLPHGALEPFYVDNELKVLEASYNDLESALQAVKKVISRDDPAYQSLLTNDDHYGTVFDKIQTLVKDRIVYICQLKQIPFPGSPSRWTSYSPAGFEPSSDSQTSVPPSDQQTLNKSAQLPSFDNLLDLEELVPRASSTPREDLSQSDEQTVDSL